MNSFMQALETRVTSELTPEHQKLAQLALGMLNHQDANGGGLATLVQQFEKAGMGQIVQSWISNSANQPVSADQITQVLGSEKVGQLAAEAQSSPDLVRQALTLILPALVDHLTPQGRLDTEAAQTVVASEAAKAAAA